MTQLVRFDTNALNRALLGFDNLFTDFERRFANQINNNYPPYNILKTGENSYQLEVAVTGFAKDELTVEVDQDTLIIRGTKNRSETDIEVQYLHHGLASRDFNRAWPLAEYIEVGAVKIKNGVLTVNLDRIIPETLKPRTLTIKED
ncbi:MAG: hypothetical protein EBX47_09120 [Synechococcaceae bacterium WB8_1B_057]|nr:hypothetical protein [Synechococcaceae bacterium WB6_1A_059]NDG79574.1 hypothetical protein [Synechococcaceae bacterium WB8_1B_057]